MIEATIRGEKVTFDCDGWKGGSPGLMEKIEASHEASKNTISGADPTPELTAANYVAAELGGTVTMYVDTDSYVKDRIY